MTETTDSTAIEHARIPRWYLALVAVLPAILTLIAVRFNRPQVGPDAVSYIAVADSIRNGDGLGFFVERPLTTWPPLWPLLLAGGTAATRWRGDLVALAFNAVMLGGTVLTASAIATRVLSSRLLRMILLAALAVSPLLIGLAAIVQTEVAFVLIAAVTILLLLLATERQQPMLLVAAGLVTAVGFGVRYQALYVVPAFALWLAVRAWRRDRRVVRAVADVCWYAVPAVVPSVAWMARNLSVSDTAMGPRFPSSVGPAANVAAAFRTIAKFVTSIPAGPNLPLALLGVVIVGVVVISVLRTQRPERPEPFTPRLLDAASGPVGLLTIFTAGFMGLMVVSRSIVGFDDLDIRLLAPCMIPVALLLLRWVELTFLERARGRGVGWTIVGVWLGAQVLVTLALLGPANSLIADSGYNAARAVAASQSPAIAALPADCVRYSNNSADLYRSGIEAAISPRRNEYKSDQATNDLSELGRRVAGGERVCLIWVDYTEDDEYHSLDDLRTVAGLEQVATEDGVTTYVLAPRR